MSKNCPYCVEVVKVVLPPNNPPRVKFCVKAAHSNRHLPPSGRGKGTVTAIYERVTELDYVRVTEDGSIRVYQ